MYVLGGLVDESIQKVNHCYISDSLNATSQTTCFKTPLSQRLSFSRAKELSVHTARLPIDEYMVKKENSKNFHSKILAINQGGSAGVHWEAAEAGTNRSPLFLQCLIFC